MSPHVDPERSQISKLDEAASTYRDIADFLDWLVNDRKLVIAEYRANSGSEILRSIGQSTQSLAYEYLDIDPIKLESERRTLLKSLRQLGAQRLEGET
jgi:hypothetical protein